MVVTPDNSTLIVAESFARTLTAFDIAPDGGLSNRRVWASDIGADGICLDADGAIWSPEIASGTPQVGRLREGGEVLQRMTLGAACFACMPSALQASPVIEDAVMVLGFGVVSRVGSTSARSVCDRDATEASTRPR